MGKPASLGTGRKKVNWWANNKAAEDTGKWQPPGNQGNNLKMDPNRKTIAAGAAEATPYLLLAASSKEELKKLPRHIFKHKKINILTKKKKKDSVISRISLLLLLLS